MSFTSFITNHTNDINNYVQHSIHWREGRFASPVNRAESSNGDFAEVVRDLPAELSREDIIGFFREDLYKGFVATIMWGGISRYKAEEIARNNDRDTTMPKLERLVALLRDSETDFERIGNAIASLRRGGENNFYGIGPSYFTKMLYFLAYDMDLNTRPLIYDENMKAVHFALMPEAGQNPFFYYLPLDNKIRFAESCSFEDVYYPYCKLMCETARKVGVDVKNLEAWAFGWPANINAQQPNPRELAKTEVKRLLQTGFIRYNCDIEDINDAIGASRICFDNNIFVPEIFDEEGNLSIGYDIEHPIVITETIGYVHMEYVIIDILLHLRKLDSILLSQHCISLGDRTLDRLCFEVKSEQDEKPKEMDVYFDITAGYK